MAFEAHDNYNNNNKNRKIDKKFPYSIFEVFKNLLCSIYVYVTNGVRVKTFEMDDHLYSLNIRDVRK